jgi:hypothetical protein
MIFLVNAVVFAVGLLIGWQWGYAAKSGEAKP